MSGLLATLRFVPSGKLKLLGVSRATRVALLAAELTRIIGSPELRSRLTAPGAEVDTMSPPEFTQFFDRERSQWAALVTPSGVTLD